MMHHEYLKCCTVILYLNIISALFFVFLSLQLAEFLSKRGNCFVPMLEPIFCLSKVIDSLILLYSPTCLKEAINFNSFAFKINIKIMLPSRSILIM